MKIDKLVTKIEILKNNKNIENLENNKYLLETKR